MLKNLSLDWWNIKEIVFIIYNIKWIKFVKYDIEIYLMFFIFLIVNSFVVEKRFRINIVWNV